MGEGENKVDKIGIYQEDKLYIHPTHTFKLVRKNKNANWQFSPQEAKF